LAMGLLRYILRLQELLLELFDGGASHCRESLGL
jgi:hypothetical protein